jgi:rhamnose utilization protein RhaD (predicted bifunctional aldolase and dehydrogenase)
MSEKTRLSKIKKQLLYLSHALGNKENKLVILGEGNTSARIDKKTFFIKASGCQLANLQDKQLLPVSFDKILAMINKKLSDKDVHHLLMAARADFSKLKPSVETSFHAWLLKQPKVRFVAHTHPSAVLKILCSEHVQFFAENRLFPDHIVYCGPKSLFLDYVDPGFSLAKNISQGWEAFVQNNGYTPRVILLKNHGVIAVGPSPEHVLASTLMVVKAAEIFLGAKMLGKITFMSKCEVNRIAHREDETYRQKQIEK